MQRDMCKLRMARCLDLVVYELDPGGERGTHQASALFQADLGCFRSLTTRPQRRSRQKTRVCLLQYGKANSSERNRQSILESMWGGTAFKFLPRMEMDAMVAPCV